jgi:hypothetical protein
MRRLSLLFAALWLSACTVPATGKPPVVVPPPPPTSQLFIHVCNGEPCVSDDETHKQPGASVTIDTPAGTWNDGTADEAGNRIVTHVPAGTYHVCASAPTYVQACADAKAPDTSELFLVLKPDVPPVSRVHVDGKVFRDESGALWQYRGVTAFLLLKRFAAGEDIGLYLDHRRLAGANVVRVLTNVSWGPLKPSDYTDDQLRAFLTTVHSHGLRVEVVALADAQSWSLDQQVQHTQRIVNAVTTTGSLDLVEIANEPFKNSAPPSDVARRITVPDSVLTASGEWASCDSLSPLVLDYVTFHPERKDEWPRTAKDAVELRDGFGCGDKPGYGGAHVPVVSDEPLGANEVNEPGRRSNVADDFYWFATTASLLGAGSTFHSEAGLTASEPGPLQAAAEQAFFAGMSSVPKEAQLGQYTRGGLGNVPLAHDDSKALRTFCSLQGGRADCVVIRPSANWSAQAVSGWTIVKQEGPRGSRITLQR